MQNYLNGTVGLLPAPGTGSPTYAITAPTITHYNGTGGWTTVGTANGIAGDSAIPVVADWLTAWANVYSTRQSLLSAISTSVGQDVSEALAQLGNFASDGVIARGEKSAVFTEYQKIMAGRASLDAASTYNAAMTTATATEKASYNRAVWGLQDYMNDGLGCPPETASESDATPWATTVPTSANFSSWLTSGTAGGVAGDTALPASWSFMGTTYSPARVAFVQAFMNAWGAADALRKKMDDTRNGWAGGTHPRTGTWISASDLANEAAIAAWDTVNNAAAGASAAFARAAALNRARYGPRGAPGVVGSRLQPPASLTAGDQWFETDYQYHPWVWSGTAWQDALQAIPAGAAYNKTYYVADLVARDALTGLLVGDLCFVSGLNNAAYRVTSIGPTVWTSLVPASTGLTTTSGTTAPASPRIGDLWWDTTGGANIPKRCTSVGPPAVWQDLSQPDGVHTYGPQTTAPSPVVAGDIWYDSNTTPPLTKRWSGSAWITIAGNKVTTSNVAPTSPIAGDTWVDTTGNLNVFKVWSGSAWVIQGSGNAIYTQASQPAAAKAGDLWYDTSTTPTTLRVYGGSAWTPLINGPIITGSMVAARTIAAGNLVANSITATEIRSDYVYAGTLTASQINVTGIDAARITVGNLSAAQMQVNLLTALNLSVGTIDADLIKTCQLTAGSIDATNMNVSNMNAGAITVGTLGAQVLYAAAGMVGILAAGHINSDSIGAGTITATNIHAKSITTDKLTILGGGASLNVDPGTSDATAWAGGTAGVEIRYSSDGVLKTVDDTRTDPTCLRGTNGLHVVETKKVPIKPSTWYRVKCRIRRSATAPGTGYLRLYRYNEAGTEIGIVVGRNKAMSTWWEIMPAAGIALSPAWSEWVGYVLTEATAVSARIAVLLNYGSMTGYMEAQDVSFEEMVSASLVVDGSITAKNMTLVDFENLWPNGLNMIAPPAGYVSPDPSTDGEFGYWQDSGVATDSHRYRRVMTGAWQVHQIRIPAAAGESHYASAEMYSTVAGVGVYLSYKDNRGYGWNGTAWQNIEGLYTQGFSLGGSYWHTIGALSPGANTTGAPAGTAYLQVLFGTWGAGGTFYYDRIMVRRRNNANLIVDGAITANKIQADAIQTSDYNAGATRDTPDEQTTYGARMRVNAGLVGGPAIIVGASGIRVGTKTLSESWMANGYHASVQCVYNNGVVSLPFLNNMTLARQNLLQYPGFGSPWYLEFSFTNTPSVPNFNINAVVGLRQGSASSGPILPTGFAMWPYVIQCNSVAVYIGMMDSRGYSVDWRTYNCGFSIVALGQRNDGKSLYEA